MGPCWSSVYDKRIATYTRKECAYIVIKSNPDGDFLIEL